MSRIPIGVLMNTVLKPKAIESNTPSPYVTVYGAGTSEANGTYSERGTNAGKPYYNRVGSPDDPYVDAVSWDEAWIIFSADGLNTWYVSSDDVAYPWLATWTEDSGSSPAPQVLEGQSRIVRGFMADDIAGTITIGGLVGVTGVDLPSVPSAGQISTWINANKASVPCLGAIATDDFIFDVTCEPGTPANSLTFSCTDANLSLVDWVTVEGAATAIANGLWIPQTLYNGRRWYAQQGSGASDPINDSGTLRWEGGWVLVPFGSGGNDAFGNTDVPSPYLETDWTDEGVDMTGSTVRQCGHN